MSESGENV